MKRQRFKALQKAEIGPEFGRRFWSRVNKTGDCWVWLGGKDRDGYGRIVISNVAGVGAHHVAFRLETGRWSDRWLLHTCDNPSCVRPSHLFEGDHKDNTADMMQKGRGAVGVRNGRAKLSEEDVRTIRKIYRPGRGGGYRVLGEMFGVTRAMIRNVVKGWNWKKVAA